MDRRLMIFVVIIKSVICLRDQDWENEVLDDDPMLVTQFPLTKSAQLASTAPLNTGQEGMDVSGGEARRILAPIHSHHWLFESISVKSQPTGGAAHSLEGTYLWAVGLLGTAANLAVVLTTALSRNDRRPLHVLVGALSITDLCVTMFYIPSYTYFLMENGEEALKGESEDAQWQACVAFNFIFAEVASVTLGIKTLIAAYLYILTKCSKEVANNIFRVWSTILYVVCVWLINFIILFVPSFVGSWSHEHFFPNGFLCYKLRIHRDLSGPLVSGILSANSSYLLAVLISHLSQLTFVVFCFIGVHRAILRGRHLNEQHKLDDCQSKLNYDRASRTTILVFVTLVLCWLPIYIVNTADRQYLHLPSQLHRAAMDLLLTKSAINPFIYLYGLKSLRHQTKLFCLCRCRSKDQRLKIRVARTSSYFSGESKSTEDGVRV